MKVAVLFSGGKDSCRTVHFCLESGHRVEYLVTLIPKREDSWLFHYPNVGLTELSAEAIGIAHVWRETSGKKGEEIKDLEKVLRILDVDAVASGAMFSDYQRRKFGAVCEELGFEFLTPFWHVNPEKFLRETVDLGFDVRIIAVYAEGFDKSWLGKRLDYETIEELKKLQEKFKINLVFEGGEAETLVLDGPIFKKRIEIIESEIVWEELGGYLNIKKAVLMDKP